MKRTIKNEQKETVSTMTGLTPQQEQACILLASGEGLTSVAEKLSLNRGTLYKWQQNPAFMCYYNKQCKDFQNEVKSGIMGLHAQAMATMRELMTTGNENTRLKASMWILEKVEAVDVGETEIRDVLREQCTTNPYEFREVVQFDERKYKKALKQYGLNDE